MEKIKKLFIESTLLEKILLLAPIFIWFSYAPNFHIGRAEGMNFEFSLTMIYIIVVALVALPRIWHSRRTLLHNRAVWLTGAFILWNIASIFWSKNRTRSILTSGVWSVLWVTLLGIMTVKSAQFWPTFKRNYIVAAALMSLFAIAQVVYGTWSDAGLCAGCLARGFGFVRPSVFAIEPQFLGSLLIAPILLVMYDLIVKKALKHNFTHLFLMLIAMYLTLSRGAIFALAIAAITMAVVVTIAKTASIKRVLYIVVVVTGISFTAGLITHAIFTELNPRVSDGFYDSISKSINQMSLGIIELPDLNQPETVKGETIEGRVNEFGTDEVPQFDNPVTFDDSDITPEPQSDSATDKALFDGYVERSTDERTNLLQLSLQTWRKDIPTMLFGVGAGGSGKAIYNHTKATGWEYEIVQNQFAEVLLELGIVGASLFTVIILGFLFVAKREIAFVAIIIAFIIQWNFFSGLPNALHIYLILAVLFATIEGAYEKEPELYRRLRAAESGIND